MKGLRFGLFLAPSLRGMYEAVAYDVCFVCSLAYISHDQIDGSPHMPIAAPIPTGSRYGRRPV